MKVTIFFLILILVSITSIAQNAYAGKYYIAKISASCAKTTTGGYMIYSYCFLKFDKDSVEVSYPQKAHCTPSELEDNYFNLSKKRYSWSIIFDKLVINDFEDFYKYSFKEEKDENLIKKLYPIEN